MATANELNEFVTCGVCLCEFDAEIKKPKFLPCSHTVCLVCLKVWFNLVFPFGNEV